MFSYLSFVPFSFLGKRGVKTNDYDKRHLLFATFSASTWTFSRKKRVGPWKREHASCMQFAYDSPIGTSNDARTVHNLSYLSIAIVVGHLDPINLSTTILINVFLSIAFRWKNKIAWERDFKCVLYRLAYIVVSLR